MRVRPTEAIVDLGAIAENYRAAARLGGRPVIAVVKADAYGHGAVPVARTFAEQGAPFLAVALVEEGIELRQAGIAAPILVLGAAYGGQYGLLVEHRLTPLVFTREHLAGCAAAAKRAGVRLPVHLKLDTGMGRIGVLPHELGEFIAAAREHPEVAVEGLCSHFASADLEDPRMTARQVQAFNTAAEALAQSGLPLKWRHLANSAGTVAYPAARQDLTRPGLMLYGYAPSLDRSAPGFKPALAWKTAITHVKEVPEGTPISYGARWVAKRRSRIATLPVGYADGYSRHLTGSNKSDEATRWGNGDVLVRGRRAPIAGTVCMDMCMVDVTDVPGAAVDDEVVLLGEQGGERIDADELARRAGTISYEILCAIGARVPRRHVGGA